MTERRKQVPQKLRGWLRNSSHWIASKEDQGSFVFSAEGTNAQCSFLKYLFHIGYRKWNLYKSWPSINTLIDFWWSSLSWGRGPISLHWLLSLQGQGCFLYCLLWYSKLLEQCLACCCLLELKLFCIILSHIFGCAGSSLVRRLSPSCSVQWLLSSCGAREVASPAAQPGLPGAWASVVAAPGLRSCSSQALHTDSVVVVHGISCSTACGIFLGSRTGPIAPALAGGFFTTEPPWKPGI